MNLAACLRRHPLGGYFALAYGAILLSALVFTTLSRPGLVAVIRYSGFWSESNHKEYLAKLQAALRGADLPWLGEAVYSRPDAPFIPWFMRRNEIRLHVFRRMNPDLQISPW